MRDHLFKELTNNEKMGVFEESATNKIVSFKPKQKELLKALLLSKPSYNTCVNHQTSKTEIKRINEKLIHNKFYSFGELYGSPKLMLNLKKHMVQTILAPVRLHFISSKCHSYVLHRLNLRRIK